MKTALFVDIARDIVSDIRRGVRRPGDEIPGSRTLAEALGVSRDTVLAAYAELEAQGWIVSQPRSRTIVADLPDLRARSHRGRSERVGFSLDAGPPAQLPIERAPKTIALYGGIPDLKEVPHSLIARAYRKALRRESVLGYTSDARGHERLRRAVAQLVRENRGVAASPDEVIITRGSQMGIDLSLRAVLRPGDVVCVEELGYRPAWSALQRSGAKIVPIPIDEDGMRIDALANVANVRLVYVTPHHQYPTTVMLTAARRMELLELARKNRFAILEDDYDYEFHYEGRSVLPLASADEAGVVVYMGTLSKILAPGLRLGFVIAPKPFVDRLARERFLIDRQGDHALELAVADLIEDDELGRHARKMRRLYQSRRDVLANALRKLDALTFSVPNGGMALWARVDSSIDVDAWAERAKDRGVLFQPGRIFSLTSRRIQAARFGFASTSERDLEEAGRRLRSCATSRGTRAARD